MPAPITLERVADAMREAWLVELGNDLGPALATLLQRQHQDLLDAGQISCTGCGRRATTFADLCDVCDEQLAAICAARNTEDPQDGNRNADQRHAKVDRL